MANDREKGKKRGANHQDSFSRLGPVDRRNAFRISGFAQLECWSRRMMEYRLCKWRGPWAPPIASALSRTPRWYIAAGMLKT